MQNAKQNKTKNEMEERRKVYWDHKQRTKEYATLPGYRLLYPWGPYSLLLTASIYGEQNQENKQNQKLEINSFNDY